MEILKTLNTAVDFIENNLTENINYNEIAKLSYCSSYNFHRVFTFVCGVSPIEYVKRRRLTQAAFDLLDGKNKVIDVAIKYKYESSESFSRAFKNMHGFSPSSAKKNESKLCAYPRMSFQINIKGADKMEYRIEKKGELKAFGCEAIISEVGDERYYEHPGVFWQEINCTGGKYNTMMDKKGYTEHPEFPNMCSIHGIQNYKKTPKDTYSYMIGAFVTKDSDTSEFAEITIPPATYVVFPTGSFPWDKFGEIVGTLYNRIYSEWFPASKYKRADSADFEMYGGDTEAASMELWIPIIDK